MKKNDDEEEEEGGGGGEGGGEEKEEGRRRRRRGEGGGEKEEQQFNTGSLLLLFGGVNRCWWPRQCELVVVIHSLTGTARALVKKLRWFASLLVCGRLFDNLMAIIVNCFKKIGSWWD